MTQQSTLQAFDRQLPNRVVYRATYRIPELAIVAMKLDEAFRSRFGPENGYSMTKHFLNGNYSLSYYRGLTSGFAISLVNTKDATGKSVTLTAISRTSKLTFWSIFFAAFVGLIVFIACLIALPLLGVVFPNLVIGFISFVVACFILILTYKLFLPFISLFETWMGSRLPDETMVEVVKLFREIVEQKCTLVSD